MSRDRNEYGPQTFDWSRILPMMEKVNVDRACATCGRNDVVLSSHHGIDYCVAHWRDAMHRAGFKLARGASRFPGLN